MRTVVTPVRVRQRHSMEETLFSSVVLPKPIATRSVREVPVCPCRSTPLRRVQSLSIRYRLLCVSVLCVWCMCERKANAVLTRTCRIHQLLAKTLRTRHRSQLPCRQPNRLHKHVSTTWTNNAIQQQQALALESCGSHQLTLSLPCWVAFFVVAQHPHSQRQTCPLLRLKQRQNQLPVRL